MLIVYTQKQVKQADEMKELHIIIYSMLGNKLKLKYNKSISIPYLHYSCNLSDNFFWDEGGLTHSTFFNILLKQLRIKIFKMSSK